MSDSEIPKNRIPISLSLNPNLEEGHLQRKKPQDKKRLFTISYLAILIAVCISFIAKGLVYLINLITNVSFFTNFSIHHTSPADNTYGLLVIFVPAIGGLLVGLMAFYGSKAIRGHGIPEAMEQILTNQSKIKPSITFLKPLSSAISIGTGGPFGAEGPIIATGGALGSTLGQLLRISHNERKILLAAGATAGMAAIFGSPIAAIFLAIELLLFEFSPRSFLPIALASITGAAGHHLLFGQGVVFPMDTVVEIPSNIAIGVYSGMGIVIGLLSVLVTKIVYAIEDGFEKLPIHWAWWPAIGGLAVGAIGYLAPKTLGVGYDNIIAVLTGTMSLQILFSLCFFKFLSWAIALGSGTSGGTLAPLLTIGGAAGAMLGMGVLHWFPSSGVTLPLAALVGMSAMFAGSSRAFLTSIVFALETTGESNALLPLLSTCTAAYLVSYVMMENTIMTEKMARRGVKAPLSYEPDILEKITVGQAVPKKGTIISENNSIKEVMEWLDQDQVRKSNYFIISSDSGSYKGILSYSILYSNQHDQDKLVGTLVNPNLVYIGLSDTLLTAVKTMAKENIDVLPVLSEGNLTILGVLSYRDIIGVYKYGIDEHEMKNPHISLKKQRLKILVRGKRLVSSITRQTK
ncbi:chloride channel protein [Flavobacteriaceae bacterium F89]|uniref:Chloride channel protein n=1 Tax=Cerina litoralis TaxID=2874477 RepID=A0AAE3EWA9_9FLAO|nr:chloride channel protein [Cerina litoralis]MCG2461695.1 chloride channel protein [Cerina litoralis]